MKGESNQNKEKWVIKKSKVHQNKKGREENNENMKEENK